MISLGGCHGDIIHVPSVDEGFDRASNADSAANIPLFIAVCVPFIFGTFMKPALHPINAPPGNTSCGILCTPPSFNALAPYASLLPSSNRLDICG